MRSPAATSPPSAKTNAALRGHCAELQHCVVPKKTTRHLAGSQPAFAGPQEGGFRGEVRMILTVSVSKTSWSQKPAVGEWGSRSAKDDVQHRQPLARLTQPLRRRCAPTLKTRPSRTERNSLAAPQLRAMGSICLGPRKTTRSAHRLGHRTGAAQPRSRLAVWLVRELIRSGDSRSVFQVKLSATSQFLTSPILESPIAGWSCFSRRSTTGVVFQQVV
jgi:hypothetical protein